MKICVGCIFAKWEKTKNGRLHPKGDGFCEYPVELPPLPELPAVYSWSRWFVEQYNKRSVGSNYINRHDESSTVEKSPVCKFRKEE